MELTRLSTHVQATLLAFVQTAQDECGERTWEELEPMLRKCWEDTHEKSTSLHWDSIAKYVRHACGR